MTSTPLPTDPTMLSDAELIDAFWRESAYAACATWDTMGGVPARSAATEQLRAELLRRLTAARPAPAAGVTISAEDARHAMNAIEELWSEGIGGYTRLHKRLSRVAATPAALKEGTDG